MAWDLVPALHGDLYTFVSSAFTLQVMQLIVDADTADVRSLLLPLQPASPANADLSQWPISWADEAQPC